MRASLSRLKRAGGHRGSWTRSGMLGPRRYSMVDCRSSMVDCRSCTAVAGCGYGATAVIDRSMRPPTTTATGLLDPRSIPARSRLIPCPTTASTPSPLLSRHRVHVRTPREPGPSAGRPEFSRRLPLNATRTSKIFYEQIFARSSGAGTFRSYIRTASPVIVSGLHFASARALNCRSWHTLAARAFSLSARAAFDADRARMRLDA